jgi:hypothetical protein
MPPLAAKQAHRHPVSEEKFMSDSRFEFEAAFSSLACDLAIAAELHAKCGSTMPTFVYIRNHETADSMETFREVFRDRARVSVVLHRDGWGHTPWTAFEELAIRERCLQTKYRCLMLVRLDGAPTPRWVPDSAVQFDLHHYSIDELVGAIKARAQELGAELQSPFTADPRDARTRVGKAHVPPAWSSLESRLSPLVALGGKITRITLPPRSSDKNT